MPRILAIDYGAKRTGLAVTDPLKIIASSLRTEPTETLLPFLKDYLSREEVETIVVGQPFRLDGRPSDIEQEILKFIDKLKKQHPAIPIERIDETYTSKIASQTLIASGVKKKKRRDKGLLDSISATLILQDYLERI